MPDADTVRRWKMAVDKTINLSVDFRSPALSWAILGPECDPEYLVDFDAIRHQIWRARRLRMGMEAFENGSRLQAVLRKWGWTQTAEFQFETQKGILDLERDGKMSIDTTCKEAWESKLWKYDHRTAEEATLDRLENEFPIVQAHKEFAEKSHGHRRVAVGASLDYRAVATIRKQRKMDVNCPCMCGERNPSRRHLMWQCTEATKLVQESASGPTCPAEEGLGIRFVKKYPKAIARRTTCDASLATTLSEAASKTGRVRAATDGGVQDPSHKRKRVAAWGLAIAMESSAAATQNYKYDNAVISFGGPCRGVDQSTAAAELAGACELVRAMAIAKVVADVFIDNKQIQRGLDRVLRKETFLPRYGFGAWLDLAKLCKQLPDGSRCWWVPSHDKLNDNFVVPPHQCEAQMRGMNWRADEAASAAVLKAAVRSRVSAEAESAAMRWSKLCLDKLFAAERRYFFSWIEEE